MSESTCYLCSQRFNVHSGWCNASESFPDNEFCPHFIPRIKMEDAAIQFFRTGKLPQDWPGINTPEYYRIVDEKTGSIEFYVSDDLYLFLKSSLIKYGIRLDEVKTFDELTEIERNYFDVIESAMVERHKKIIPRNLNEAYSHAQSVCNHDEATRLLKLIYERDRKGFRVI
ncbi:MAG: hypothetical protein LC541_07835 [Candidatus Thiodiazotropha sp.]|nr:hypothetical protein [Candidatus Thiodiazotropha sp.]MCM8883218.1 hypothetical protein [Candidatus Thiodiazotropha sp.]MCM8920613.1 hypothetical protein [Candidatus Thiodiazotropha sp.]